MAECDTHIIVLHKLLAGQPCLLNTLKPTMNMKIQLTVPADKYWNCTTMSPPHTYIRFNEGGARQDNGRMDREGGREGGKGQRLLLLVSGQTNAYGLMRRKGRIIECGTL